LARHRLAIGQHHAPRDAARGLHGQLAQLHFRAGLAGVEGLGRHRALPAQGSHLGIQHEVAIRRHVGQEKEAIFVRREFVEAEEVPGGAIRSDHADLHALDRAAILLDAPGDGGAFVHPDEMIAARLQLHPAPRHAAAFGDSMDRVHAFRAEQPEPALLIGHCERVHELVRAAPLRAGAARHAFRADRCAGQRLALRIQNYPRLFPCV
jgi:hypothetical protein